jgi:hypothetical protein
MELKDFISETMKALIDGIIASQEYAKSKGASVVPEGIKLMQASGYSYTDKNNSVKYLHDIQFDVAVTINSADKIQGGIGIFAGAIGVGTQAKTEEANSSMSRIKFSIPVIFPEQK